MCFGAKTGQTLDSCWDRIAGCSPTNGKNPSMATLEKHDGVYRIDFCFGGRRFRRSLKTESEKRAKSILANVEQTLDDLSIGRLVLPAGAEIVSFVLSAGKLEKKQSLSQFPTLGLLLDAYRASVTNLEPTTDHCVKIHIGHFRRVF